jgi:hypothetical protein
MSSPAFTPIPDGQMEWVMKWNPFSSFLLICMVDFLTSVHRQDSHLGRTIVSEIARGSGRLPGTFKP